MEYTVAAVHEALGVLMHVAHSPGLGVTELAKRSGNTKARAFRMLCTLEQDGFVQRGPTETQYMLGHMALVLGLAAQEQVSLARIANKYLAELGERFNENVQVRVRDGLESVTVAKWDSTRGVRVHSELGSRRPLYAGASSKVLLAYAPKEVQTQVLNGPLERFTEKTIARKTKLSSELARIQAEQCAVSLGEVAVDVVAVAAPIWDASGSVTASLGVSIPVSRMPSDFGIWIDSLKSAASRISQELGWRQGTPRV